MRLVIHSSDVIAGKSYGSDITSRRSVRYVAGERAEDNWIAFDELLMQQWDSGKTNRATTLGVIYDDVKVQNFDDRYDFFSSFYCTSDTSTFRDPYAITFRFTLANYN